MDTRDLKFRGLKYRPSNLSSVEQFKTQVSADSINATNILQMIEHTFHSPKRRPLTETFANALFSKVLDAFQQNKLDDASSVKVLHEFLEFSLNECEYHLSMRTKALRIINKFLKKKGVLKNFVVKENEDEIKLFGDHLSVFGDYEAQTIILKILLKISHGKNRLYWSGVWFESEELKSRFINCNIHNKKESRAFLNKYNKSLHRDVRRVWSLLASSVTVESSDREMKSEVQWKWINFNKGTESISFNVPEQEQNVECRMLQIKTSDIDHCILTVSPGNAQLRVTLRRTTSELLQSFRLFSCQRDIGINIAFTFHYFYTNSLINICNKCQVPLNYDDSVFNYIGKYRKDFHVPVKASVTKTISDVESFMQTGDSSDNLLSVNEIPNIAHMKKSKIPLSGVNQTIPENRETVSSDLNEELVGEALVAPKVKLEERLPSGERILNSKAKVFIGKPQYGFIEEPNGESAGGSEFDVDEPVQAALQNEVQFQSIVREELVQLDVDDVVDEFEKIGSTHAICSTSTGKHDSGISTNNSLPFHETSHNTLNQNVGLKSRTRLTVSFLPSMKQSQQVKPNKPKHLRGFPRKALCNDFMCSEFYTKFNTKVRRRERPLPILFEDIQSSNDSSTDVEQPHHHRSLSRRAMPIVGALSMRMRKLRKSQIISTDMDTGSAESESSWCNGRKKRRCSLFETPRRNYSRCNRIHHKNKKSPAKVLSSSSEQDRYKRFFGHKSPRKRKATAKLLIDLTSDSDNDIGVNHDKEKWSSIDNYQFVVEKSGSKSNDLSHQAREESDAGVFSSFRFESEVPVPLIRQKLEEFADKIGRCELPEPMEDLSDSLTLPVAENPDDVDISETDSTVPKKVDKSTQLDSSEDYDVADSLVDYYSGKFLPIAHSTLLNGEAGKLGVCESPKAYHSDSGISSFDHRHKTSKMSVADHHTEMPSAINISMLSNLVNQDITVNALNDITRLSMKYAETVNHHSQKLCTVLSESRQRVSDFLKEFECEMICYSKPAVNLVTYLRDCRKQRLITSEKMNSLEETFAHFFSDEDSLSKKLSLVQATASGKYYKEVNDVLKEASKILEDATLKEMKCYLQNVNSKSFSSL